MRRFGFVLVSGILALLFSASPTLAGGDVLLPSDTPSTDNGAPADLGLLPPSDTGEPAPFQPLAPAGQMVMPNIDPKQAAQDQAFVPTVAGGFTPTLSRAAQSAADAAGVTTKIIRMPPPRLASTPAGAGSPGKPGHDMTITIDPDSKFGENDFGAINRTLGFTKDEAKEHCHITISGYVMTDKTMIPYRLAPGMLQGVMRLSNKPTSIMILNNAFCDALPVSDHLGTIMQVGDKYSVSMQTINCKPPPEDAEEMIFKYTGDGKGSCNYH